jgi:hypothetical protein
MGCVGSKPPDSSFASASHTTDRRTHRRLLSHRAVSAIFLRLPPLRVLTAAAYAQIPLLRRRELAKQLWYLRKASCGDDRVASVTFAKLCALALSTFASAFADKLLLGPWPASLIPGIDSASSQTPPPPIFAIICACFSALVIGRLGSSSSSSESRGFLV